MLNIILAFICALIIGCSSNDRLLLEESEERLYKRAKDFQIQGRHEDALINYLSLIAVRRESPESHLEAGYIYLNALKDPIRSIYHFDRYLELKPESAQSTQVKQLIETAKKEFIRQIPTKPFQTDIDRVDLLEVIKKQQREFEALKKKYNQALLMIKKMQDDGDDEEGEGKSASQNNPTTNLALAERYGVSSEVDPSRVPRTYVIQAGDSLSKISKKFYGTESRFIDILQANRDNIPSERALRIGLEIVIP